MLEYSVGSADLFWKCMRRLHCETFVKLPGQLMLLRILQGVG